MTESAVPASGSRRSEPATAGPSCAFRMVAATLLTHSSRESSRTLCKHFTSVSPDLSGHRCQTDRAPMLVGTPLPVILSVFRALGPALWIRRDLAYLPRGARRLASLSMAPVSHPPANLSPSQSSLEPAPGR